VFPISSSNQAERDRRHLTNSEGLVANPDAAYFVATVVAADKQAASGLATAERSDSKARRKAFNLG